MRNWDICRNCTECVITPDEHGEIRACGLWLDMWEHNPSDPEEQALIRAGVMPSPDIAVIAIEDDESDDFVPPDNCPHRARFKQ